VPELEGAPPPTLMVQAGLDAVRIDLPRRASGSPREHRKLALSVLGAAVGAAAAGGAAVMLAKGGLIGLSLAAATVLIMGLLPYGVLIWGNRRLSAAGSVVLGQQQLKLEGRHPFTISLEEVGTIEVVWEGGRGWLEVQIGGEASRQLVGLQRRELDWIAGLLRRHVARRQQALHGPAQPPEALMALRQR
jgi:hypothetical protein